MRSLRGRLSLVLSLLVASALATGALMFALFAQSAAARASQAQAELARACDGIASEYRFFVTGWSGSSGDLAANASLRASLTAVVQAALLKRTGVEGGIRLGGATPLAYAFPTYEGAAPKTDEPVAENARIAAVNSAALNEERLAVNQFEAGPQILLIAACPLPGPISGLTAWTMYRVHSFAGASYNLLMAGIVVLLMTLLAAAFLLGVLTRSWSRHVAGIETALQTHDVARLPRLPATGERELDRIVAALNDMGDRLDEARRQADNLTRQLATRERLAALGRVAAGVAHEIRNPIAAMRLRAESALGGDAARQRKALGVIVEQIDRLEAIVSRIVRSAEGGEAVRERIELDALLQASAEALRDRAQAKDVTIEVRPEALTVSVDPAQIRTAVDNLLANAVEASAPRSRVELSCEKRGEDIVIIVRDYGPGVPEEIRGRLFEPFSTGRPDGAGLGLAAVREIAAAHQGEARLVETGEGAAFEIVLPCRPS